LKHRDTKGTEEEINHGIHQTHGIDKSLNCLLSCVQCIPWFDASEFLCGSVFRFFESPSPTIVHQTSDSADELNSHARKIPMEAVTRIGG
jgi:hypothetical protein